MLIVTHCKCAIEQRKRFFNTIYEEVEDEAGNKKQRHYIVAPTGLFAIFTIENNDVETTNYILKDHIGSINYILNDEGNVVQELNFDAWGRRRNPTTWQYYDANATLPIPLFERGYTLHEHLDAFKLINMNGRMYDPVVARFLSADPVIQSPENSQSYNSYSYVFNNPLRFMDPSGFVANGDSTGDGNNGFGNTVINYIPAPNGGDEGASSFNTDETQKGSAKLPANVENPDLLETGRSKLNKKTDGSVQQVGSAGGGGYSENNIFAETYLHYQFGGTKDLNVNTSSLDMSGINMRTPEIKNIIEQGAGYINLFSYMKNQTGLAIGSVQFNYQGNNTFTLSRDLYDFDIRWNEGNTYRNWATFGAGLLHGPVLDNIPLGLSPSLLFGGPYWINFQGTVTLKP